MDAPDLICRPERDAPTKLPENKGCAYVGSFLRGMGFAVTPDERDALIKKNKRNAQRIFPYLGGQEVNSSPTQDFHRYVISFGEMSLNEAETWPDLLAIVREKVKPERDKVKQPDHRTKWWIFGRSRPELYAALAPLSRCLVNSQVTKHLCFAFQPTDSIFGHTLYAYPLDHYAAFAVLQSRIHEPWARLLSSSLNTNLRYAASDCFDNFPFPQRDPRAVDPALEMIGKQLYAARAKFMVETHQGLTKTYNALKDSKNNALHVRQLRKLHEAMDRAVLDAYGWEDIAVPPYAETNESFKMQVFDRLYETNKARTCPCHTTSPLPLPNATPAGRS